jgi:hypothetical protein
MKERPLKRFFPNGKEDIDKYFIVDEENQKIWNRKTGNELKFSPNKDNYPRLRFRIGKQNIYIKAHLFFWYYKYGDLPPKLDHRNRDGQNYNLENLRPATNRQNSINSVYTKKVNTHLPANIYKVKNKNTLFVKIAGQYIGCSTSLEEAIKIRNEGYKKVYSEEEIKFLPKDRLNDN